MKIIQIKNCKICPNSAGDLNQWYSKRTLSCTITHKEVDPDSIPDDCPLDDDDRDDETDSCFRT
jgi:hypothetical protein